MSDFTNGTFSVGTTAANLFVPNNNTVIRNDGPFTIFLGGSTVTADVTSTGGLQLQPGASITLPSGGIRNLWGITGGGTSYLSYLWG